MGRWEDQWEEETKAVSIGSFISCFELHGAPFLCVVVLTTTSKHIWFCLPFPKCRNSLDNQMLPFGLTRCASLLRTMLKALLDATCWTLQQHVQWWLARVEGTLSSCWCFSEQSPAEQPLRLFSYQLSVGPCKMAGCIFNSYWTFPVWKNMLVICWITFWFSWKAWLTESSYVLQL